MKREQRTVLITIGLTVGIIVIVILLLALNKEQFEFIYQKF